jgi:hypothetical protein
VFRQERPETATFPQAKHANIAGVEPPMEYPCGKCRGAASVVRESVFNLEKLFESLLSGSLSEVIAQVCRLMRLGYWPPICQRLVWYRHHANHVTSIDKAALDMINCHEWPTSTASST